jgi:NitT/TauT family transport system permease protein
VKASIAMVSVRKCIEAVKEALPVASLFIASIVLWVVIKAAFPVPDYILPRPIDVLRLTFSPEIPWFQHIWITVWEIVLGFVISAVVGVGLGMLIAWSHLISRTLLPFLVFLNTLPKVAVAPLILLWFGYGLIPNALIAASIGFFPVVINSAIGLNGTPGDMLDLGRIFGAPKWKVFLTLRFPLALPFIMSALRIAASTCVVGVIVGEFVASQKGLGSVIVNSQTTLNTPVAFAAIVWISVLGLAVYGAVHLLERWVTPWAEDIR